MRSGGLLTPPSSSVCIMCLHSLPAVTMHWKLLQHGPLEKYSSAGRQTPTHEHPPTNTQHPCPPLRSPSHSGSRSYVVGIMDDSKSSFRGFVWWGRTAAASRTRSTSPTFALSESLQRFVYALYSFSRCTASLNQSPKLDHGRNIRRHGGTAMDCHSFVGGRH